MAQSDTQANERTDYEPRTKGVLDAVAEECAEREQAGESPWLEIAPTTDEQEAYNRKSERSSRGNSEDDKGTRPDPTGIILGNYVDVDGRLGEEGEEYPIKGGFKIKTRENSDEEVYEIWRTSKYYVHYRIVSFDHPEFGEVAKGLIYVRKADGQQDD